MHRIADASSANGTFLNGERFEDHVLDTNDVIRAGETLFVYDRGEPADDFQRAALRVAKSELTLLITGETGTGKELLARAVHEASGRAGPFVAVNCGALPRELALSELFGHTSQAFSGAKQARAGLFAAAQDGTLFLDEVGELGSDVQPVLLRALQERTIRPIGQDRELVVNARVIAATNRLIKQEVADERFRADLYARLAQVELEIPPLRARRAEILRLASELARKAGHTLTMTANAAETLLLYDYPFNVRELESMMRALPFSTSVAEVVHRADLIRLKPELSKAVLGGRNAPSAAPRADLGRNELKRLLEEHGGNISRVAESLGKPRVHVYRMIKRFGLKHER
jgi:two-component system response regulator HydG